MQKQQQLLNHTSKYRIRRGCVQPSQSGKLLTVTQCLSHGQSYLCFDAICYSNQPKIQLNWIDT